MAHLIDTIACTSQSPWHGLDNILPPLQALDLTISAALTVRAIGVILHGSPRVSNSKIQALTLLQ